MFLNAANSMLPDAVSPKTAAVRYMRWLKKTNPKLWALLIVENPELKTAGLGDIDWDGMMTKITDGLAKALPIYQQQKLFKTQLELAKAGQPMLSPDQMKQAAPPVQVQVDIPPELKGEVEKTSTQARGLMTAGLIGGGLLLMKLLKG